MTYQQLLQKIHATLRSAGSADDVRLDVIELMQRETALLASQSASAMVAQRHPLGFFACRWSVSDRKTLRLHLWSKQFGWAQEAGWEIHDHVFSFSSLVLLGSLRNRIYEITNVPNACSKNSVYEVAYDGEKSSMELVRPEVSLGLLSDTTESSGTLYAMDAGVLHASDLLSDHAVTVLATCAEDTSQTTPRVVSAHQSQPLAFDRSPISASEVSTLLFEFAGYLNLK